MKFAFCERSGGGIFPKGVPDLGPFLGAIVGKSQMDSRTNDNKSTTNQSNNKYKSINIS